MGQQSLTKLNAKQVAYMSGSFSSLNNMYGSDGNSSFVIQGTHHITFLCFSKLNPQNFSVTRSKINSTSDLLISYPSITQTQIKHSLPTSFQFRVNLYIKLVVSKTRENSRLNIRYLKGITTEQLFIISIQEIILSPLYFIQLLKIENQTHIFILFQFVMHLFISFANMKQT